MLLRRANDWSAGRPSIGLQRSGPSFCPDSPECVEVDFREFHFRDCPKRGTNNALSANLDVLGGKYGSKSAVLVLCKATGQAPLTLFGQSQKRNSQKSVCRMPHSPDRWPSYGRPEISRLIQVDHYMLDVRIKMRLGAYASSRPDTHYAGRGVVRSLGPRVEYRRSGLPGIGVYTSRFEGRYVWLGPRVVEDPRRGFNGARGGLGGPWSKSADRAVARRTIFCRNVR